MLRDPALRELVALCALSTYCSRLAWLEDYAFFAAVFAAASLMALIMAVPRVRRPDVGKVCYAFDSHNSNDESELTRWGTDLSTTAKSAN
jgi:hypothetical protein